MNKATLRKNGIKMLTIRVRFDFGYEHVIRIFIDLILDQESLPTSRRAAINLISKACHAHGHWVTYRSDEDCDHEKGKLLAAEAQAEIVANRLFPDLKGA